MGCVSQASWSTGTDEPLFFHYVYVDDGKISCGVVAIICNLYQFDIDIVIFLNDFQLIRPVLYICTVLLL